MNTYTMLSKNPAKWTKAYAEIHAIRRKKKHKHIKNTVEYKQFRTIVLTRDNYTCVSCHAVGGYLEVHHILPKKKYPHLALEPDNAVTLCLECHYDAHPEKPRHRPWKTT